MITICLFITICVIAVLCLCAALWDTLEPWALRIIRNTKRGLCARWLAEAGMVAVRMEAPETVISTDLDEMLSLINRF